MNRRSLQTIAIVVCAAGLVYTLIVLQKSGALQTMWSVLTSGAFGGLPL
jgi:hypothetical protein